MFENSDIGNLIYGAINAVAAKCKLNSLTSDEFDKVVKKNLISVDILIANCYQTVEIRRRGKISFDTRKPNPIRQSPLFRKEEMELIIPIASKVWSDLAISPESYWVNLTNRGFTDTVRMIHENIQGRWEVLQRFAHVTKLRLQLLRKKVQKPELKKRQVVQDDLGSYLKSIHNPADKLVDELQHIFGAQSLHTLCSIAFNVELTAETVKPYLLNKAINIYNNILGPEHMAKVQSNNPDAVLVHDNEYNNATKCIVELEQKIAQITNNMNNLNSCKTLRLYNRFIQLGDLLQRTFDLLDHMQSIHDRAIQICANLSGFPVKSGRSYLQSRAEHIYNIYVNSISDIKRRIIIDSDPYVEEHANRYIEFAKARLIAGCLGRNFKLPTHI
jgi:hypothetical protein